jgi:pantoate--beta-alanine ligase
MLTVKKIADIKQLIGNWKNEGKQIGFVPTMGALHQGHVSLVKKALIDNDIVVVSIFVNPTQFNDQNDLKNYPRTLDKDVTLLELVGCSAVFAPEVSEMYPEPDTRIFDFSPLDCPMEGAHRPGHFNGVGQIVSKLFSIVMPHKAYFGEKDFQQLAIIQKMVRDENFPITIVPCPIVRETDGLALSSRNALLNSAQRALAPRISQTLFEAVKQAPSKSISEIKQWVIDTINAVDGFEVDYFEIVDSKELTPVTKWEQTGNKQGCIAVKVGSIRLIDNIRFNA